MTGQLTPPSFAVIPGAQVDRVLTGGEPQVMSIVEDTYLLHGDAETVNPPSYFLRFPDRPASRIIALPAAVGGSEGVDGIKWISSFPRNIDHGLPRASAVLILNDPGTGYPYACLESSIISAARTAASAALAADRLTRGHQRPARIGFVGAGLIARYVHTYLRATGWDFGEVGVFDLVGEHASTFAEHLRADSTVTVHDSATDLITSSDLVVFATVAAEPHITDPELFAHNPVVLHLSLRDLAPEVVLAATNITDDIDHCLKARTSLHLAEMRVGHRDFVDGTLHDVLTGKLRPRRDRPLVFSPFGLGVLDLAVGKHVYDSTYAAGELATVPGFFHELRRHG